MKCNIKTRKTLGVATLDVARRIRSRMNKERTKIKKLDIGFKLSSLIVATKFACVDLNPPLSNLMQGE